MNKNSVLKYAVKEWLYTYKKPSVKPSTFDRLITTYNLLLKSKFSECNLSEIESKDVQGYINELVKQGFALTTIKKQTTLITAFLKFCHAEGYLDKPVYNNIRLPCESNVDKPRKEIEVYDDDEQAKLTAKFYELEWLQCYAALFMMATGLRIGEVLALEWKDVLCSKKAVRVSKTLIRLSEAKIVYVQNGAKSFNSNRVIPLSETAMQILDKIPHDTKYIFEKKGKPINYESMRWHIQKACEMAGVEYRGMHVFRHTFATNCYHNGCDVKILSKLLGHADVNVTYNTYIHLFGDALEEMRKVIG